MRWRKSTKSNSEGNCVEVAVPHDAVLVRDSKDQAGPVLRFTPGEWRAFVDGLKTGQVSH